MARRVVTTLVMAPTQVQAAAQPRALELLARAADLRADLERSDLQLDDAINVSRQADVLVAAARAAHLALETANEVAETKLRSERKAGAMLRQLAADAGPWKRHPHLQSEQLRAREHLPRGALAELGITSKESSAWQLISRISDSEFEARVQAIKQARRQLHSGTFVRAAQQYAKPVSGRPTTPVASTLRRILLLLKNVTVIATPIELDLARQVVAVGASWASVLNEPSPKPAHAPTDWRATRQVTCILCGRGKPASNPPRCQACGGQWFES